MLVLFSTLYHTYFSPRCLKASIPPASEIPHEDKMDNSFLDHKTVKVIAAYLSHVANDNSHDDAVDRYSFTEDDARGRHKKQKQNERKSLDFKQAAFSQNNNYNISL